MNYKQYIRFPSEKQMCFGIFPLPLHCSLDTPFLVGYNLLDLNK